jgi:hypothetical protein
MNGARSRRSRLRAGLLVFGLLASALVLLNLGGPGEKPSSVARRERASSPRPTSTLAEAPSAPPAAPVEAVAPRPNLPPRLTEATLDRTHLCPGESTFLRITAEDPDDTDLRYQVTYVSAALGSPRFGFGRWVRYQAPAAAGTYGLIAVVEDPSRARDELPLEVVVEDCATPPAFSASQLRIHHTELDAQVHEFDLDEARERAREAGKEFEVVRWKFGDGETLPGTLRARHRYATVLDRRYSYYLIQADVRIDGTPDRIEYGLPFYSYAAANLQSGYVALAADVERGDDRKSSVDYVVTFSNITPFSASANEFEVTCLDAAGLPRARWSERLDLTVPGETSLEQTLQLDRGRCPGGASYELFGEAEGGYAVGGLWSYKLRPTAPVTDAREARQRARLVLGAAPQPAAPRDLNR